jgi:hypothetical protein
MTHGATTNLRPRRQRPSRRHSAEIFDGDSRAAAAAWAANLLLLSSEILVGSSALRLCRREFHSPCGTAQPHDLKQ